MTAAEAKFVGRIIEGDTILTDVLTALRNCQRARRTLNVQGFGGHRQALRDLHTACVTLVALVRTLEGKA